MDVDDDDSLFIPFGGVVPAGGQDDKGEEEEEGPVPCPWLKPKSLSSNDEKKRKKKKKEETTPRNVLVELHDEMLDFLDLVALTPKEEADRWRTLEETRRAVEATWDDVRVEYFGSQLTGLVLPTSDLDVVVFGAPATASRLRDLAATLEGTGEDIECVETARVPLVKFRHSETGVCVDISFDVDSGLRTGNVICDLLSEFPALKPLALIMKYFLHERGLNETYSGGLGSYASTLIVASFLQHRKRVDCVSGMHSPQNLGSLLLECFELYAKNFNFLNVGLSVRDDGSYFRKRDHGFHYPGRPHLLAIENPDEPFSDVGKNSFLLLRIKAAFDHAYLALLAALRHPDDSRPGGGSILAAIFDHTDSDLIKRVSSSGRFQPFRPEHLLPDRFSSSSSSARNDGNDDDSPSSSPPHKKRKKKHKRSS